MRYHAGPKQNAPLDQFAVKKLDAHEQYKKHQEMDEWNRSGDLVQSRDCECNSRCRGHRAQRRHGDFTCVTDREIVRQAMRNVEPHKKPKRKTSGYEHIT